MNKLRLLSRVFNIASVFLDIILCFVAIGLAYSNSLWLLLLIPSAFSFIVCLAAISDLKTNQKSLSLAILDIIVGSMVGGILYAVWKPKGETLEKGFFTVKRICVDGMLTAVYCVLSVASFSIAPNVQITFAGLAIAVAAFAFGLGDAVFIAFIGAFISQLRSKYGLTVTTPLWMIPPMLRGVVIGIFSLAYSRKGQYLEDHPIISSVAIIVAAITVTAANTLVMFLDAVIIGYAYEWVWVQTLIRFGVGILEAGIIAALVIPLMKALRKTGLIERAKVE